VRWDPSFFRKSPLFWPVADVAAALEQFSAWPAPDDLNVLFREERPVRFVAAPPKPRRRHRMEVPRYDARIALEGIVPTRAECWHDLLNAVVWASFPRAKRALHARQHRMIAARLGHDARMPGARTKEQDAVAMIDEGGVVVLRARASAEELAVIFGHAIYEGLVCGGPKARGAAYVVTVDAIGADARERADVALAELLTRDTPLGREDLGTIAIDERLAAPAPSAPSARRDPPTSQRSALDS
jgi:hypothetical protein